MSYREHHFELPNNAGKVIVRLAETPADPPIPGKADVADAVAEMLKPPSARESIQLPCGDALVAAVEDIIGIGAGAWDQVNPRTIIQAAIDVYRGAVQDAVSGDAPDRLILESMTTEERTMLEFLKLCVPSLSPELWKAFQSVCESLCNVRKDLRSDSFIRCMKILHPGDWYTVKPAVPAEVAQADKVDLATDWATKAYRSAAEEREREAVADLRYQFSDTGECPHVILKGRNPALLVARFRTKELAENYMTLAKVHLAKGGEPDTLAISSKLQSDAVTLWRWHTYLAELIHTQFTAVMNTTGWTQSNHAAGAILADMFNAHSMKLYTDADQMNIWPGNFAIVGGKLKAKFPVKNPSHPGPVYQFGSRVRTLADHLHLKVDEWLDKSVMRSTELNLGVFPQGFVNQWIARAEAAETSAKVLTDHLEKSTSRLRRVRENAKEADQLAIERQREITRLNEELEQRQTKVFSAHGQLWEIGKSLLFTAAELKEFQDHNFRGFDAKCVNVFDFFVQRANMFEEYLTATGNALGMTGSYRWDSVVKRVEALSRIAKDRPEGPSRAVAELLATNAELRANIERIGLKVGLVPPIDPVQTAELVEFFVSKHTGPR